MTRDPIIFARIVDGPITPAVEAAALADATDARASLLASGRAGASLRFDGVVRLLEPRPGLPPAALSALIYQTYDPMAQRELETIARDAAREHGLAAVIALHSRGRVPVGFSSFTLIIDAPHRAEALAAAAAFIDRMKRDAPIWKLPETPDAMP